MQAADGVLHARELFPGLLERQFVLNLCADARLGPPGALSPCELDGASSMRAGTVLVVEPGSGTVLWRRHAGAAAERLVLGA